MMDLRDLEGSAYLRASDDKARGSVFEGFSTSGQKDDILDVAEELGIHLPDERIFCDNDLGGSTYGKKRRQMKKDNDWEKLLKAIEAQSFKVLILWECSRGSRDHLEWAQFLDLIVKKEILVYVITKNRALDPTDPEDWEILANEGVKSASESHKISARTRRGARRARRRGRPLGQPPLGWESVHDPKTGKMITWQTVEPQISLVREIFSRVAAGEGIMDLALELNERSNLPETDPRWVSKTRHGKAWTPAAIKNVISSPTQIGKRWVTDKDGKRVLIEGSWGSAIDENTWWDANNRFRRRKGNFARPEATKYLLPGIARCGLCGSVMETASTPTDRPGAQPMLRCAGLNDDGSPKPRAVWGDDKKPTRSGHTAIIMRWADGAVREAVIDRLMDSRVIRDLTADVGEEESRARAQAAKIRAEIEAWKAAAHDRAIEMSEYLEYKSRWEPEAQRLEEAAEEGMRPGASVALDMVREAEESGVAGKLLREALTRTWDKVPLRAKRDLVELFLVSVTINRARRGCRTLEPGRIVIE